MAVVAMTREMGSLGKDVAAGLADQMGLHGGARTSLSITTWPSAGDARERGASLSRRRGNSCWSAGNRQAKALSVHGREILELARKATSLSAAGARRVLRQSPMCCASRMRLIWAPRRVMMRGSASRDAAAARRRDRAQRCRQPRRAPVLRRRLAQPLTLPRCAQYRRRSRRDLCDDRAAPRRAARISRERGNPLSAR